CRWRCRGAELPMGKSRSLAAKSCHPVLVWPCPAWSWHVAGSLLFPFVLKLRYRDSGPATFRGRSGHRRYWGTGMVVRLLPASGGLASATGDHVPGFGIITFAIQQLPNRTGSIASAIPSDQDVRSMGDRDNFLVLGGSLDRSSTHADARNFISPFAGGPGRV